jgi:C2 domain
VNPKQDTCRPQFFECFEIPLHFPQESQIVVSCMDWDKYSADDLIGKTTIDLEHRMFSDRWQQYKMKPIEHRSLWCPSSKAPQGVLKMYVDVLEAEEASRIPPDIIAPPQPLECEIRVIIWETEGTAFKDKATMGLKERSDIFITVCPEFVPGIDEEIEPQKTDIHRNCETGISPNLLHFLLVLTLLLREGQGLFNWRMKFPVTLPTKHARCVTFSPQRDVLLTYFPIFAVDVVSLQAQDTGLGR